MTDWYPRQLERHTRPENQRPFDASAAPGIYTDRARPSVSITRLGPEQLDAVASARLGEDMTVPFPALAVTYPKGTVLNRGQLLTLRIIHDSIQERPIYFSAEGGMLSELGLRQWGVRHGLVIKLEPRGPSAPPRQDLVRGSEAYGGGWVQLERSLELYDDVYLYRGIRDRPIWQDRSSLNIPAQYYVMALLLADAVSASGGDVAMADRLRTDASMLQLVATGGTELSTAP
jgi:hypothetical protein